MTSIHVDRPDDLIDLEAYAEAAAHLHHYAKAARVDVLRALGRDEERFARSEAYWQAKLTAEAEEGEPTETVLRFGAAYGACLRRLRRERPPLPPLVAAPLSDEDHAARELVAAAPLLQPGELSLAQLSNRAAKRAEREPRKPNASAALSLDATLEHAVEPSEPALPFGNERSPEFLAEWVRDPRARESRGPARDEGVESDEGVGRFGTEELDIQKLRARVLPFAAATREAKAPTPGGESPVRAPEAESLSLERYAALRARLSLAGESDLATLTEFGIASVAIKTAIQEGFAERFRRDPALQRKFVELVRRALDAKSQGNE